MIEFNKISADLDSDISKYDDLSEDSALMELVVRRDKVAYERLLDLHMNSVFRFCYSMLQERGIAEDVTQEVFLRLWKNASSWQPKGKVKSWLLRIAHNLSIDEIRKRKPQTDIETVEEYIFSEQISPEEKIHRGMVEDVVRESILRLPDRQKEAIMLSYYSMCSNKEGAEVMGVSIEAFESLLARGKSKLKYVLENVEDKF